MRSLAILLALALAGCGGGGSSTPNPPGVPAEVTVLADCVGGAAAIHAAVLDRLALVQQAAADAGSPPAGVTFPVADAMSGAVQFLADVDVDGDAVADGTLSGNAQFLHPMSGPGLPMPGAFTDYMATTTWDLDVGGQLSSGSFQTTFSDAAGSQMSLALGLGTLQSGVDCASTFTFETLSFDAAASDFPTGDLAFDASAGGQTLQGTLSTDGTAMAAGTASFDGTDYTFDADLLTGNIVNLMD